MSTPLFDQLFPDPPLKGHTPLSGGELKQTGMESVLKHTPEEWKQRLKDRVRGYPKGYKFTMDRVVDSIGGRPYEVHPNAIGALTHSMAKEGLIKRTGVLLKAERASLHRTDMPEWIRL
jgi:hypothetical protein